MSLILAVEPDRHRAAQLASMARNHLDAEFILAHSVAQGFQALGERVPDLLLTAPLLPPGEESALDDYLRLIGPAAAHVLSLTIPLLAAPGGGTERSLLSAFRREKPKSPDANGCEPAVFADQITTYLREARRRPVADTPSTGTPDAFEEPAIDLSALLEEPPTHEAAEDQLGAAISPDGAYFTLDTPPPFDAAVLPVPDAVDRVAVARDDVPLELSPFIELPVSPVPEMEAVVPHIEPAWIEPEAIAESAHVQAPGLVAAPELVATPDIVAEPAAATEPELVAGPEIVTKPELLAEPVSRPVQAPIDVMTPRHGAVSVPDVAALPEMAAHGVVAEPTATEIAPAAADAVREQPPLTPEVITDSSLLPALRQASLAPRSQRRVPPPAPVEAPPQAPQQQLVPFNGQAPPPVPTSPNMVQQVIQVPTGTGVGAQASVSVAVAVSVQVAAAVTVNTATPKRQKPRPVQDEWGFFDPGQCGFQALVARLDQIAADEDNENA